MSVSSWARLAADAEPAAAEAAGLESPLVASVLASIVAIRQDAASARRARGGGRVDRGDARVLRVTMSVRAAIVADFAGHLNL